VETHIDFGTFPGNIQFLNPKHTRSSTNELFSEGQGSYP